MRIPLCLVTGFLGSGKTSLLKSLVGNNRHRNIVYLVNEFSAQDVDGGIILDKKADVVAVPGGSIFCKCLITQFIGHMRNIPDLYPKTEGVVIEASGMADPRVIETMLKETKLDEIYELSNILVVVDAGSYNKLQHTLPNIVSQVQSANSIILNKIDLFDDQILKETETALQTANPDAQLLRTTHGTFDKEIFPSNRDKRGLKGKYALCKDPNYSSEAIHNLNDVDLDVLRNSILAKSSDLYRVKGFVSSQGTSYYIDFSSSGLKIDKTVTKPAEHSLAVIYKGNSGQSGLKL